jgi:uncharacterized protein (DUF1697 family)
MAKVVAFLRAINLGGTRTVRMGSLRQLFESLGFSDVETFIASGNIVFRTRTKRTKVLERKIEKNLREAFGFDVEVFVRTAAELAAIEDYDPFAEAKVNALTVRNIVFLKDTLDQKLKKKVEALKTDTDKFRVRGREIHWLRRRKGESLPFSTVPLQKILDRPFTIRAFNTISRMVERYFSADQR